MTAIAPSRSTCQSRVSELQKSLESIVAAVRQLGPAAEATLGSALLDAGSLLASTFSGDFDRVANKDSSEIQDAEDVWLNTMSVRGKDKRIALSKIGPQVGPLARFGRTTKPARHTAKIAKLSSTRIHQTAARLSFDSVLMRKDLGFLIFRHLDADNLAKVGTVCRCWKIMARDERLWMWLYLSSDLVRPSVAPRSWRADFMHHKAIQENWSCGRYRVTRLLGHREAINCMALHGQVLVSGADDHELRVWHLGAQSRKQTGIALVGHEGKVLCCCIVRGMVVSGGEDKVVIVWDLGSGVAVAHLRQHSQAVLCMVSEADRFVYTGGADQDVIKWDVAARSCVRVLKSHQGIVLCLAMGAGQGQVITGGRNRDVRVWDTLSDSASPALTLSGHEAAVTCLSAEGNVIASGSDDKTVRVWNAITGCCLSVIEEHGGPLSAVRLAGRHLVSGSFDGRVRQFEVLTGALLKTMTGHRNAVLALDVRGGRCVSGGNDRDLRVWDLADHSTAATGGEGGSGVTIGGYALGGHNSGVQAVAIANANCVVSASDDYELRVWDFSVPQRQRRRVLP